LFGKWFLKPKEKHWKKWKNSGKNKIIEILFKSRFFFERAAFFISDFMFFCTIANMNQSQSMLRIFQLVIFVLIFIASQAQTHLTDINLKRIKQKGIRTYLKNQMEIGMMNFEDFRPSVNEQTDSSQFNSYKSHFYLKQTPATAWKAYLTIHPAKIWQGKVISYGFIYSPNQKSVIFNDDSYPGLEIGQVFFIEMRLLFGIVRVPICMVVTEINTVKHEISFSYIDSGPSKGSQNIRLENNNNGTNIIHSSIHKTSHVLRDKIFYPIYHRKAVGEVHRNIRKLMGSEV
jgi:hypothetical protein